MQINEGTYDARIIKATLTETKPSAGDPTPIVELIVELTGGALEEPVELAKAYWLGDKIDEKHNEAEWKVSIQKLREFGFEGDDVTQLGSIVGFVGKAGVINKTKNNATSSTIQWIGKAFGSKPMDPSRAQGFAAKMKARIAAMGGGAASAPSARPVPTRTQPKPAAQAFAVEPDDTDVPF